MSFASTAILRLADGRIAEAWDEMDVLALFGQIGEPSGGIA